MQGEEAIGSFPLYLATPGEYQAVLRQSIKGRLQRPISGVEVHLSAALLESLHTLHKLLRIAREEGQTWLVEILERERESEAAQAAVALENANRRAAERAAK